MDIFFNLDNQQVIKFCVSKFKVASVVMNYKLARLVDGDINKRWYVVFYVKDKSTGQLIRKRDYSINTIIENGEKRIANAQERRKLAKKLINEIDDLLRGGYLLDSFTQISDEPKITTILQALRFIIQQKKLADYTLKGYNQVYRVFEKFEAEKGKTYKLAEYDKLYTFEISDWRRAQCGATTMNQFVTVSRLFFQELVEREFISVNYFNAIKKPKPEVSRNVPFDEVTAKLLLDYMKEKKPGLWLLCLTIYYTFMRVRELRNMRASWIIWERELIKIPAEFAKGRKKGRFVKIPKSLMKLFKEQKINELAADWYVFGLLGPQTTPAKIDTFTDSHNWILKTLKLAGRNHTLYAWKHTGVIAAYRAGVDIKTIQIQCGHSNLQTTDIYLRNLGVINENDSLDKMPEF